MGAIAEGKVNASEVQTGMRVIVKASYSTEGHREIGPSRTKTGEGVTAARILNKVKAAGRRGYVIFTNEGSFYAEPIQTMWLAPEDAAGIKRAHAEALELDKVYEAYPVAETEMTEDEAVAAIQAATAEPVAVTSVGGEDAERAAAGETAMEAEQRHLDEAAQAPASPVRETTGSAVVKLLERVYDRIRENHPELPAVVMVTGSGSDATGQKWGHFRPNGWMTKVAEEGAATSTRLDEMFMAGETMAKGARQVLQTMLHESAHTLAKLRNIQDTSRQGRWHNAKFRTLAEEMGLAYRKDKANPQLGFSEVVLTDETLAEYADLLAELDDEIHLMVNLPIWLGGLPGEDEGGEGVRKPKGTEGGSASNNLKLTCTCEEPNIIRASRKVAEKLIIRCDDCEHLFRDRG